MYESETFVAFY